MVYQSDTYRASLLYNKKKERKKKISPGFFQINEKQIGMFSHILRFITVHAYVAFLCNNMNDTDWHTECLLTFHTLSRLPSHWLPSAHLSFILRNWSELAFIKCLIDGMYRGESVTFLWGLWNQQARVVGLSWCPPVVFSRHVSIIRIIKDSRKVQESKVEWSDKDSE